MTDRFKVRVWDRLHKTYSIVQYGNYALSDDGELFWLMSNCDCSKLNTEGYIVEQSTGLRDANGQIIFEGDIIKMSEGNALVVWNKQWVLNFGDFSKPFWHFSIERYTIIGNIHENKELLK